MTRIALPPTPPVLVMNLHYTGLGIGRNLRSFGVTVDGLSSDIDAPGSRSRAFRRVFTAPHSRDDPGALHDRLVELRRQYADSPVIFPTCDADVLFLAEFADRLAPHYRLPPGLAALPDLMDKLKLSGLAERESIEAPKTVVCACAQDIEQAALNLVFPLVIKPRSAHEWRKKGVWNQVGARKAIQVETPAELASEYASLAAVSAEVLVQEYVPGDDSDIVVCCCYIDERGELLGHFTGRKLRQSPPLFGTGCLVEASPVAEIVALSQRLLHGCGYSGIAEVEFKRDSISGRHMLIEVNPRHWDQHQLGTLVGVNLSWIAYQRAIGNVLQPCSPTYDSRSPPRWIAEREALLLVARNAVAHVNGKSHAAKARFSLIRIAVKTLSEGARLIRRPFVLSIISSRDPVPGILFCARLIRELFAIARHMRNKNA